MEGITEENRKLINGMRGANKIQRLFHFISRQIYFRESFGEVALRGAIIKKISSAQNFWRVRRGNVTARNRGDYLFATFNRAHEPPELSKTHAAQS
jgi:hypothetical protein